MLLTVVDLVTSATGVGALKVAGTTAAKALKSAIIAVKDSKKISRLKLHVKNVYLDTKAKIYAAKATHNANSDTVVLGRYIEGSKNSYEEVAKSKRATYFEMNNWNEVQAKYGKNYMWNINKAFLDRQIAKNKKFMFTSDPKKAPNESFTYMEYNHLIKNNYIIKKQGDMYIAIKSN